MAVNDYASVSDLRAALPDAIPSTDTSYDALLTSLLTRASRLIDRETGRDPGAYAVSSSDETTRYYTGSGGGQQWVDELAAAPSAVKIAQGGGRAASDYSTVASTDFDPWPYNAAGRREPYLRLDLDRLNGAYSVFPAFPFGVQVTGAWGYATTDKTPDEVVQATIMQAARWFGRGRQGYQDSAANPALGQMQYTQKLDPEVAEIIRGLRRQAI